MRGLTVYYALFAQSAGRADCLRTAALFSGLPEHGDELFMLVANLWNILFKRNAVTFLDGREQVVHFADVRGRSPVARFCDFVGKNGDERKGKEEEELHCRREFSKE